MKQYIGAITTESGYILALGAIYSNNNKWIRWFCPGKINVKDYPRVIAYPTRKEAQNHIRYVLKHGKKIGVFSGISKSKVIEIYPAQNESKRRRSASPTRAQH